MQSELGYHYTYDNFTGEISNSQQNVPFQYGSNSPDVSDFLNSIFVEPEEHNPGSMVYNSCLPIQFVDPTPPDTSKYTVQSGMDNISSISEDEVSQKQVIYLSAKNMTLDA